MDENHPYTGRGGLWGLETPRCKICFELTQEHIQTIGLRTDLSPGRLVSSERNLRKVLQALRVKSCRAKFYYFRPFCVVHGSLSTAHQVTLYLPRAYQIFYLEALHF